MAASRHAMPLRLASVLLLLTGCRGTSSGDVTSCDPHGKFGCKSFKNGDRHTCLDKAPGHMKWVTWPTRVPVYILEAKYNLTGANASTYVLRVFPLCALVPRVQGSSGAVATVQYVWRGHVKTPTTRAGPWPDFALRLE